MILSPIVWIDDVKQSIQDGFSGVIDGITDSLGKMFSKALSNIGIFLLDGVCTFIIFFGVFVAFKIMTNVDEEKQKENYNLIGILCIAYPIIRLIIEIINRSILS